MERVQELILHFAVLLCLVNSAFPQACNNTDVQLAGNRNKLEGQVEICFQGQWGTVCDYSWDTKDAMVVCRQLGLNAGYAAAISTVFVHETKPIILHHVRCRGHEANLNDCPTRDNVFCGPSRPRAGVRCLQVAVCNNTDIRLVGERNNSEGRVEVCFQGQWGTVCDDDWDTRDAIVVCRQLGLNTEYATAINAYSSIVGPGTGPIFLDDVGCIGNETNFDDCPHKGVGFHNCFHSEDAGVICPQVAACNNTDIRLIGGRNNLEGRVEVCFQGQWGTVCGCVFWDTRDAIVACRQLGFNTEYAAAINVDSNNFIHGTGPIFLYNVSCSGNETNLDDCPHNGLGVHQYCLHRHDAGVICLQVAVCNNSDIRLVEGRNNSQLEGRVEVCFQGQWGTVCDDSWDTRDAVVACSQLGLNTDYATAINVYSGIFGRGTGPIFLENVGCRGNETNLYDCPHSAVEYCYHSRDAGVICPEVAVCNNTDIRLVGGKSDWEGRVEVCFQGQWGTVCDYFSWDFIDAVVACRQLRLPSECNELPFSRKM